MGKYSNKLPNPLESVDAELPDSNVMPSSKVSRYALSCTRQYPASYAITMPTARFAISQWKNAVISTASKSVKVSISMSEF